MPSFLDLKTLQLPFFGYCRYNPVKNQTSLAWLPQVSYVSALDVWMCSCIVFVFVVLLEYVIILSLMYRKSSPPSDDQLQEAESRSSSVGIQTLEHITFDVDKSTTPVENGQKNNRRPRFSFHYLPFARSFYVPFPYTKVLLKNCNQPEEFSLKEIFFNPCNPNSNKIFVSRKNFAFHKRS